MNLYAVQFRRKLDLTGKAARRGDSGGKVQHVLFLFRGGRQSTEPFRADEGDGCDAWLKRKEVALVLQEDDAMFGGATRFVSSLSVSPARFAESG